MKIYFSFAETPFLIFQSSLKELLNLIISERVKLKNTTATDQRTIDCKERILGRCANEDNGTIFDIGQQHILLSAIESVDFVEKEQRAIASRGNAICSLGE